MDTDDATTPVEGEDTAAAILPENTEVTEAQFDDDGNPIEVEDDEEFELDEGLKLRVPKDAALKLKELKEGTLRQADYTRKTQEVAEQRKALEAERQAVTQASQEELGARAEVIAIDQRLAEYQNIDWDRWEQEDPLSAQRGWRQFQTLQNQRQQAVGKFAQLHHQRTEQAASEKNTRLQKALGELQRDIPGYDAALGAKLQDFGIKTFGFTAEELADFEDARMVKVLHAAFEGAQARDKAKQAQKHLTAQQVTPAAKVGGKAAPIQGLDDRLSIEEWNRRRTEQLRKRG